MSFWVRFIWLLAALLCHRKNLVACCTTVSPQDLAARRTTPITRFGPIPSSCPNAFSTCSLKYSKLSCKVTSWSTHYYQNCKDYIFMRFTISVRLFTHHYNHLQNVFMYFVICFLYLLACFLNLIKVLCLQVTYLPSRLCVSLPDKRKG